MKITPQILRRTFLVTVPVLVVAGIYFWAFGRAMLANARPRVGTDEEVVRVGHIFLDQVPAFQAMASAYERLCRERGENVRIVQVPVPQAAYASWFTTQLAGGTMPELVALNVGSSTERLARHFEPLSDAMLEPNPYNAGTGLEGRPWRDTFPDGLPTSYNPTLLEYYAVPMTNTTTRLVINLALYREICGAAPLPRTYDEFIAVCRKAREFSARTGRALTPIASSLYHAPVLLRLLTRSQTRQLAAHVNRVRNLRYTDAEQRLAYLEGGYTLRTPAVLDLLAMTGEVAGYMTPGFFQLRREDASFRFFQGQALMLVSFSNEVRMIAGLVSFPTAAFRVPVPTPNTPRYGRHVPGRMEDKSYTSNFSLALTRDSPARARALDFLRFAGSLRGNQIFCEHAGWVPAVESVRTPPELAPFLPDASGGFQLGFDLSGYDINQAGDAHRVVSTNIHLLTDAVAGPEKFIREAGDAYTTAVRNDARRELADTWETVRRDDAMIALLDRLAGSGAPEAAADSAKRDRLWEASLEQEATARLLRRALARKENSAR
jgi:raffinose/stachyose/melibiose transport system substrate-binding protein